MNHPFLKSPIGETPVILEAQFNASNSRVFRAWTNSDDVKQWFGADEGGPEHVSIDFKIGGKWQFAFAESGGEQDILSGRYLEIETDRRLVFSWIHTRINANGETETSPESKVSIHLEPRDQGTFLKLIHEAISSEGARINIGGGWSTSISKLKGLVE